MLVEPEDRVHAALARHGRMLPGTGVCVPGPRTPGAAAVPNAAARGASSWIAAAMVVERADAVGEATAHVPEAAPASRAGGLGAKSAVVRGSRVSAAPVGQGRASMGCVVGDVAQVHEAVRPVAIARGVTRHRVVDALEVDGPAAAGMQGGCGETTDVLCSNSFSLLGGGDEGESSEGLVLEGAA
eukprot:262627-Chlamydomonas_euryale.AAC.1